VVVEDGRRSEEEVGGKRSALKVLKSCLFISSPASLSDLLFYPVSFPTAYVLLQAKTTFLLPLFLFHAHDLTHPSFIPLAQSHATPGHPSVNIVTPSRLKNVDIPPLSNNANEEMATILQVRP
jgi:hypothetical protein